MWAWLVTLGTYTNPTLLQDSALIKRLASVLTRRVLRFFDGEARRDPERYNSKFFQEFGQFLKEGAITDTTYAPDIAKVILEVDYARCVGRTIISRLLQLLRFESSVLPAGTLTSLDDYISRMPPGQKDIYYLVAPHRGIAEESPCTCSGPRGVHSRTPRAIPS